MANKEIYSLIKNGIKLSINNADGRQEQVSVRVIDFNYDTNNFLMKNI